MSNRKAHRRDHGFRRFENFVQHRLRRPGAHIRLLEHRKLRRTARFLLGLLKMGTDVCPTRFA